DTSGGGADPLLPFLPLLVALVCGVAVARLLPPLMRACERRLRHASAAVRIAVVSVAREPLGPAVAAAFLAVALGLAFFASTYRATLSVGQEDQAAFDVPADVTLSEGAQAALAGPVLQPGEVAVPVHVSGAQVAIALIAQRGDGSITSVSLGTASPHGAGVLRRQLPADVAGARLVALQIDRTAADSKIAIHQQGEGGAASGTQGALALG